MFSIKVSSVRLVLILALTAATANGGIIAEAQNKNIVLEPPQPLAQPDVIREKRQYGSLFGGYGFQRVVGRPNYQQQQGYQLNLGQGTQGYQANQNGQGYQGNQRYLGNQLNNNYGQGYQGYQGYQGINGYANAYSGVGGLVQGRFPSVFNGYSRGVFQSDGHGGLRSTK